MNGLSGQDIVCFSNDWGGDPLSKTHLMRRAARNNRVLWVNSLGNRAPRASGKDLGRIARKLKAATEGVHEVEPNLHVLSPLAVPLPGQPWARATNARLVEIQVKNAMRRLGMKRPIVIAYLPTAAPVVDRLDARLVVYHCVDDFPAFEGAGNDIATLERELMDRCDLMVCASQKLLDVKAPCRPDARLMLHGVDVDHFSSSLSSSLEVHPLVRDLPRPRLVFMGLVAEWVDQELLVAVARHFRNGTIVMLGKNDVDVSLLRREPNIALIGRHPYAQLPSLLKGMDAGLITFKENDVAVASNPLKAREYLAAGLPVVSTPIPEVNRLGLCHVASGAREFIGSLEAVLATGAGPSELRARSVHGESWDARWEQLSALIDETMRARGTRHIA